MNMGARWKSGHALRLILSKHAENRQVMIFPSFSVFLNGKRTIMMQDWQKRRKSFSGSWLR